MADDAWVIPLVIVLVTSIFSAVMTLLQRFANKNEKVGTATISGTIHLDFLNKELQNLTEEVHDQNKEIIKMERIVELNSYRISELERKTGYRNGAVNGNGVHK